MDVNYNYEKTFDSLGLFTEKLSEREKWYYGESYINAFATGINQDLEQNYSKSETLIIPKVFAREKIVPFEQETPNLGYSRATMQYEGCVTKVFDKSFTAILYDENGEEFSAEFAKKDASEGDQNLIKEDNIFYWSLGYRTSSGNQRTNEEKLIFRRLPGWKNFNLDKPSKKAKEFGSFFNQSEIQNAAQG